MTPAYLFKRAHTCFSRVSLAYWRKNKHRPPRRFVRRLHQRRSGKAIFLLFIYLPLIVMYRGGICGRTRFVTRQV